MRSNRGRRALFGTLGLLASILLAGCVSGDRGTSVLEYPDTPIVPVSEEYHGITVVDPYRWLETAASDSTRDWIAAQNELTESTLSQIESREAIRNRLSAIWNHERYDIPERHGDRFFFERNDGLQDQSVLCAVEQFGDEPTALLDPNLLSSDGTVSLGDWSVSEDAHYLAYGLSSGGSDWTEWRIRDLLTGLDLDDLVRWVKFSSIAWTPDNEGFFYGRYDEPEAGEDLSGTNAFQKLFYHRVGTAQAEDRLAYERPDQKEWGFEPRVTEDGHTLIVEVWKGSRQENGLFYRSLDEPGSPMVELLNRFDAEYQFIGNDGPIFWVRTTLDAPFARLVAIDTRHPEPEAWSVVIPERPDAMRRISLVGDRFVVSYLVDAHSRIEQFQLDGTPMGEIELPGLGSARGFTGRRAARETFFSYESFTTPRTILMFDFDTGTSRVVHRREVDFDSDRFVTEQIFYPSKDGTRIPMFLTHRRDLKRDGHQPTFLYGYGGFNIAMTPYFSTSWQVWLEMGGILAVANLRGGGEYGQAWHDAGRKKNRQNVFDDFIAAAEWLIANDYTSSDRLAIGGGSNGGLLVGACMTQRPDLFAAAVPQAGVLDMIRYPLFTIGWAWISDYGDPHDPEEFSVLYSYSPVHNARPAAYPATLITTADHDDRVVPAHSYKFAAALQAAQEGPGPILLRVETKAGHAAGTSTSKKIAEQTDLWAFIVHALGMEVEDRW